MIHFLDWLVAVIYIQMGTLAVHVLRCETAAVVVTEPLPTIALDRSLHLSTSNLYNNMVISLVYL